MPKQRLDPAATCQPADVPIDVLIKRTALREKADPTQKWAVYGRERGTNKFYRIGPYDDSETAWAVCRLLPSHRPGIYHNGGGGVPIPSGRYGWYVAEFNLQDRYDEWRQEFNP